VEALAGEHAHGGVEDDPPLVDGLARAVRESRHRIPTFVPRRH
jgi:hypothetical protein